MISAFMLVSITNNNYTLNLIIAWLNKMTNDLDVNSPTYV